MFEMKYIRISAFHQNREKRKTEANWHRVQIMLIICTSKRISKSQTCLEDSRISLCPAMILPSSQAIYSLTKLVEPTALTKFLSIFANLLGKFNLVICVILFPLNSCRRVFTHL